MGKIVQLTKIEKIDHESGQVTHETRETVTSYPSEPQYVKMYLEDVGKILDVSPGPRALLYQLAGRIDYEGFISFTPASRKRVAEACGIDVRTLANYLTKLCAAEILHHAGRGEYVMNPKLFAKGDWKAIIKRREAFQMLITYQPNGTRTITTRAAEPEQLEFEDLRKAL